MSNCTSYEVISDYVTENIRSAMLMVSPMLRQHLSEIRIRSGRAVSYVYHDSIKFLTVNGMLVNDYTNRNCIITSSDDITTIINALCHYSMHSCTKELHEGYFILDGGIRVGAAGTYTDGDDRIITDFNGLNFRISRSVEGCAEELFERICRNGGSILICGGVNSGKTTILRDLCRLCGNICKVSLIDERNEISSTISGNPRNDVGVMTDIIVRSDRSAGIMSSIRTLSPDMIFCDEISEQSDAEAILRGHGCGVRFAATLHAESYESMKKRPVAEKLLNAGVFDYAVILEGSNFPSKVKEIRRLTNGF